MFGKKFGYLCFFTKVCNQTNLMVVISNMIILLSNSSPKVHKSHIFDSKFMHSFFREVFQIDKFEGDDLKFGNSIFKSLALKSANRPLFVKNTQIRHFWSKFRHFYFFRNFSNQTNLRVQVSNMTIGFLNVQPQNK